MSLSEHWMIAENNKTQWPFVLAQLVCRYTVYSYHGIQLHHRNMLGFAAPWGYTVPAPWKNDIFSKNKLYYKKIKYIVVTVRIEVYNTYWFHYCTYITWLDPSLTRFACHGVMTILTHRADLPKPWHAFWAKSSNNVFSAAISRAIPVSSPVRPNAGLYIDLSYQNK